MKWVKKLFCFGFGYFILFNIAKGIYIDTSFEDGPGHKPITIRVRLPDFPSNDSLSVLYMFDGQNLFDSKLAFAGEWNIDETLDSLTIHTTLIVAIYNRGSERLNDYTPWWNAKYGGGKGDETIRWMVQVLKPWVDTHYKVHRGAQNTGIMGSSLGGLMALTAGVKYPTIFGRIGVFSPALWYSDSVFQILPKSTKEQLDFKKTHQNQKWYFVAGYKESEEMVPLCKKWIKKLKKTGMNSNRVRMLFCKDGLHQEWFWAREFCSAYLFLF